MIRTNKRSTFHANRTSGRAESFISGFVLIVGLGLFLWQCIAFDFTQDDAFISFRYLKNFLNGQGLVYNPGERVEGYTNFLWIIVLAFFTGFGLEPIELSKSLGIIAGCGTILILVWAQRKIAKTEKRPMVFWAPLWLAAAGAFAYWSVSGLETALFTFLLTTGIVLALLESSLTPVMFALATLTRPEGLLGFGLIFVGQILWKRNWKQVWYWLAVFALLVIPLFTFRLWYYRTLVPNPFFAKTGLGWEYIKSGFEYTWLFLKHYGLYGGAMAVIVIYFHWWSKKERMLALIFLGFVSYIILIGGDVLKVHRFFVPVLPIFFLLLQSGLQRLLDSLTLLPYPADGGANRSNTRRQWLRIFPSLLAVGIGLIFWYFPRAYILQTRFFERELVTKMKLKAQLLKASDQRPFSAAVTTIGAFGFYLPEHVIIDMLGLVDPYIARRPQTITGFTTTWKERKFNAEYLLTRAPDYFIFSTGVKPSAPAERALFLYGAFRRNYTLYGYNVMNTLLYVYRKMHPVKKPANPWPDPRFVNLINTGISLAYSRLTYGGGSAQEGVDSLKESLRIGPPDNVIPMEEIGFYYRRLNQLDSSEVYLRKAIAVDSLFCVARLLLARVLTLKDQQSGYSDTSEQTLDLPLITDTQTISDRSALGAEIKQQLDFIMRNNPELLKPVNW